MGRAVDCIAAFQTTVGSTFATGVMATGDPNTVRNFASPDTAEVYAAFYDDVTTPLPWRVRSPLLHDNVRGIQFGPGAPAPSMLFPAGFGQQLRAQDTLTFELSTAATTGKALGALGLYYSNLPGAAARLYDPMTIAPLVVNLKPVTVAIGSGANTPGIWLDTVLTATENLLHANTDYAVLGVTLDVIVAALAIKGPDTGNLRVPFPGGTNNPFSSQWSKWASDQTGMPLIPVINAANIGSTFLSLISSVATAAASTATVYLAELRNPSGLA